MNDSRISLRNPWVALGLGLLVPGLGHAYQGRTFKAVLYFVCITGMFLAGAQMSEWKAVQAPPFHYRQKNRSLLMLKFAAQCGMGIPAVGAMIQTRRYLNESNRSTGTIPKTVVAPFHGTLSKSGGRDEIVDGEITLTPTQGPLGASVQGSFRGTNEQGQPVELTLEDQIELDPPINANRDRGIVAIVFESQQGEALAGGKLKGAIVRPLTDWLGVPLDDQGEQDLEGRLGKWHELAMVLTWIAGLLNMLAMWDAFEGPAYGYSDRTAQQPAVTGKVIPAVVVQNSAAT
jgi:hypothetical protein